MRDWRHMLLVVPLVLLPACGVPATAGVGSAAEAAAQPTLTLGPPLPTATAPQPTATQAPFARAAAAIVPREPPASCPVTRPPKPPFVPPRPWPAKPVDREFWYGTRELWTMLPHDGTWWGLPKNPEGYTQKVFWWHEGYVWTKEPEPTLTATGRRLDGSAPPLAVSRATNAFHADFQSAMLIGVDFPALGCWEITGRYKGAALSFVVWVAP